MAVGQILGTLNQMQQQQQTGKIPSQGQQPHQASAVTVLRSGKTVDNKVGEISIIETQPRTELENEQPEIKLHRAEKPYRPPVPFPCRLRNERQD